MHTVSRYLWACLTLSWRLNSYISFSISLFLFSTKSCNTFSKGSDSVKSIHRGGVSLPLLCMCLLQSWSAWDQGREFRAEGCTSGLLDLQPLLTGESWCFPQFCCFAWNWILFNLEHVKSLTSCFCNWISSNCKVLKLSPSELQWLQTWCRKLDLMILKFTGVEI